MSPVLRRVRPSALVLLGLILVALALRLWQLGDIPFGFHTDEGHNALDSWRIAGGWRPLFLERNNGREPLYMYLMAVIMAAAGPTIWSARLAGVFVGVLLVPVQYGLVRSLPVVHRERTALISAALVAVTFWPVAQSRYALRANLLPLFAALLLWAWWRALRISRAEGNRHQTRRYTFVASALAGLFLAGAVYTHMTGRLLPLVLLVSAVWVAARERRWQPIAALVIALATAGAILLPLVGWFVDHPQMVGYRAAQVSVLNPEVNDGDLVGALAINGKHLLLAPFTRGDTSWYHNLSRRPIFTPLLALAFAGGLLLLIWDALARRGREAQSAAVMLGVALVVTVVPSWLSMGAPNYVRLTGAWPVIFLLPALGLASAAAWLDRQPAFRTRSPHAGNVAIAAVIGVSALWATVDYFGRYASRDQVYQAFNGAAVERGYQVAELAGSGPLYVSPVVWNQSVIRFLNAVDPPRSYDHGAGLVSPPTGVVRYALESPEEPVARELSRMWPALERRDLFDSRGERSLIVLEAPANSWPELEQLGNSGVFGGSIDLYGVRMHPVTVEPGGQVTVTLEWRMKRPTDTDMNLFVHLVSEDGVGWGQWDGPPLNGSYPTNTMQAGERILTSIAVPVAADAPPGVLRALVGWYDWRTVERLTVDGTDESALDVGAVQVVPRR